MLARAVIFFILHILFLPQLTAQQDTLHPICKLLNLNSNWDFRAGARITFLDFEDMNRSLEAAGLPGLRSPLSCLELGLRSTSSWKNFKVESGFRFSFGASNHNNSGNRQSVTFRDYALQSRLMLDVLRRNKYTKIYPYVGLGVSHQVLHTYSEVLNLESNSLNGLSIQTQRFSYIPFSFETGLSVEQSMKLFGKRITLGFRSGYAFRFFQTNWSLDGNYALDLPKPAASAPYVALIVRIKSKPKTASRQQQVPPRQINTN